MRWWRSGIVPALFALVLLSSGCVAHLRASAQSQTRSGTCESACDHYLTCKGDRDAEAEQVCLAECTEIFVHDGEPDRGSLLDFESMQCEAVIAFVDGDGESGSQRPAGAAAASRPPNR